MVKIFKYFTIFLTFVLLAGCTTNYTIKSGEGRGVKNIKSSIQDFKNLVGDRVFFDYDDYNLSETSRIQLDKQIKWLKSFGKINAIIEGHCDERGTEDYNFALGESRAESVRNYMIYGGIDSERLDIISYGKSKPEIVGNGEESWKYNRRAVTSIVD